MSGEELQPRSATEYCASEHLPDSLPAYNNFPSFILGSAELGVMAIREVFVRMQVVVHNLPWSCTWQMLKDVFSETPGVVRADVIIDSSGRSRRAFPETDATP